MTAGDQAGSTTIRRLACTYALPRDLDDPTGLRFRLEEVVGERLAEAVGAALGPADAADRGTVWVIRSLRADALVSATTDDLDVLARQWGGQLGDAILTVLRRGPGGNVVRFPSRAEYVAAFVSALAARRANSWVFEPLAGLRLLAPATALRVGAESADVPVAEVVAELAAARGLESVLAVSSPGQLEALWAACLGEAAARPPAAELVERVVAASARGIDPAACASTAAARSLRLFGAVAPQVGRGSDVVAAVDAIVDGSALTTPLARAQVPKPAEQPTVAEGDVLEDLAEEAGGAEARTVKGSAEVDSTVFAAAGAPALLVLPALEAVGLGALDGTSEHEAAAVRARVLELLLGCPADEAILLASGAGAERDAVLGDPDAIAEALLRTLDADGRVDGRRLRCQEVAYPDGDRRLALVRDAVTGAWLAGALVHGSADPPWTRLVDGVARALDRRPEAVGEDPDAAEKLRPPASDVAWLAPADDAEVALALVARAAMHHFARRLLGFERASMPYVVERFLPPGGIVTLTPGTVLAELPEPPLQVVLVMAGLDTVGYRVPWLDREIVVTHGTT